MRRSEIVRQFDAIVDFAEVDRFLDTPIKHFSSGMHVRLGFAVAAHLGARDPDDRRGAGGRRRGFPEEVSREDERGREGGTDDPLREPQHGRGAEPLLLRRPAGPGRGRLVGRTDEVLATYQGMTLTADAARGEALHRDERLGVALERLDLLDEFGSPVPALETGRPGAVRMVIPHRAPEEERDRHRRVQLVRRGRRVCVFYSALSGDELRLEEPVTHLVCRIPKVPLQPGKYRLTLKATAGSDVLFYLPGALEVAVDTGTSSGRAGCRSRPGEDIASWSIAGKP